MTSVDPSAAFAALGVYAVTVLILCAILIKLWAAYQTLQTKRDEDQKVALPALERASVALAEATKLMADRAAEARIRAAQSPGGRGDG